MCEDHDQAHDASFTRSSPRLSINDLSIFKSFTGNSFT
jgi:hypothetical protein